MKQKIAFFAVLTLLSFGFVQVGGAQWQEIGPIGVKVYSFAEIGNNLFIGTTNGVFISTNNGSTWVVPNFDFGLTHPEVFAVATRDDNLFAGTFGHGTFISIDSGKNWTPANNGVDRTYVTSLAISKFDIYALIGGPKIIRSSDNGLSWSTLPINLKGSYGSVFIKDTNIFIISVLDGILRSRDRGDSWNQVDSGLTGGHEISSLTTMGGILFASSFAGPFYSSTNDGNSWSQIFTFFSHVSSLLPVATNLFAASSKLDQSPGNGVFLSTNYGINWKPINEGLNDTNINALIVNGDYLFAGSDQGVWRRPLTDFGINAVPPINSSNYNLRSFPNPFSTQTTISISIGQRQFIDISILDMLGKKCTNLFFGQLDAGDHSFEWAASLFPAGMYLCVIRVGGEVKELPLMVTR